MQSQSQSYIHTNANAGMSQTRRALSSDALTEDERRLLDFYMGEIHNANLQINHLLRVQSEIRERIAQICFQNVAFTNSNTSNSNRSAAAQANQRSTGANTLYYNNRPTVSTDRTLFESVFPRYTSFPINNRYQTQQTQQQLRRRRNNNNQNNNNNNNNVAASATTSTSSNGYNNHNYSYNFTTSDNISDIITSLLTPVVVAPTPSEILNSTVNIAYRDIVAPLNDSCPISLEPFQPTDAVTQIRFCGHIFNTRELNNWFMTNVRCPVCRYDIRNYSSPAPNNNFTIPTYVAPTTTMHNNNTSTNTVINTATNFAATISNPNLLVDLAEQLFTGLLLTTDSSNNTANDNGFVFDASHNIVYIDRNLLF